MSSDFEFSVSFCFPRNIRVKPNSTQSTTLPLDFGKNRSQIFYLKMTFYYVLLAPPNILDLPPCLCFDFIIILMGGGFWSLDFYTVQ